MPRIHPLWIFFQHFVRPWERRAPASTDGMCASPGSALGSASGALTGRRPGRPQPRAAKRVTAAWLPTSRAAARSMSIGGSSPAAPARSPFNNRQSLAIKRSDGGRCTAGRAAPARAPARGRGACAAQGLTSQPCSYARLHPRLQTPCRAGVPKQLCVNRLGSTPQACYQAHRACATPAERRPTVAAAAGATSGRQYRQ